MTSDKTIAEASRLYLAWRLGSPTKTSLSEALGMTEQQVDAYIVRRELPPDYSPPSHPTPLADDFAIVRYIKDLALSGLWLTMIELAFALAVLASIYLGANP
jgi:hypothetical protein